MQQAEMGSTRKTGLIRLLRILSVVNFAAVVAVVVPRRYLAICHEWLGLGSFPEPPITAYLARSTSLWFAAFGILLWFVTLDLARYANLIVFLGWAMVIQGFCMIGIDWSEGLPGWWIAIEGPTCMALGIAVLMLQREPRS